MTVHEADERIPGGAPGVGVDAHGGGVVDPTKNVLDLVRAESKYQDAMRNATERRQDDLRAMSDDHIESMAALREKHAQEQRVSEAGRIDANRQNDQAQVQRAAEVQSTAASALANQVAQTAEASRNQVAAAATATATALATALNPIIDRLAEVSRVQYEQAGQKVQVAESAGQRQGGNMLVVAIIGAVLSVLFLLTTVGFGLWAALK